MDKTLKEYIIKIYEAEQWMWGSNSGLLYDIIEIRKDLKVMLQYVHTTIGQLDPFDENYSRDINDANLLINLINFLLDGNDVITSEKLMKETGYLNRRLLLKDLNTSINKKSNQNKTILDILYEIKNGRE